MKNKIINLDKIRTLGILGDRNTGKTSLLFYLIRNYKGDREVYLYGYPKDMGYKQVHSLQELSIITDSIIVMDELQKHIKFYTRRMNDIFLELLSTMAHNNNTIIFTTPMSQYVTKALDCFIDGFLYTRIKDLSTLKNGSKAKRRLIDFSDSKINKWSCNLQNGEYLEVIDTNEPNENGLKTFPNQSIQKDWRTKSKKILTKTLK